MNSENAVADHYRSGGHQKNVDKKARERGDQSISAKQSHFDPDSLQYKLLTSKVKPLGLQMVEQYENGRGLTYYKCNLCGAHGKLDTMYHHLIGKKHTVRYIRSACVLQDSIITANEREELRNELVRVEGINCPALKVFKEKELYPRKWEAEAFTSQFCRSLKQERRSSSSSPLPKRHCKRRLDSPNDESPVHRKVSPKHSPEFSRSKTPSLKYRNRSPSPVVKREKEGNSTQMPLENPIPDSSLRSLLKSIKQEDGTRKSLPSPTYSNPPPPPSLKTETRENGCQKHDLEEVMVHLNLMVEDSSNPDETIKEEDIKSTIDMLFKTCDTLYHITCARLEDSSYKTNLLLDQLKSQKEILRKIMGYIKHRMEVPWMKEHDK